MIRILLDEDVPAQLIEILRKILPAHHVDHIHDIGWSGSLTVPKCRLNDQNVQRAAREVTRS